MKALLRGAAGLALALAAGVGAVAQETPMPLHGAPRSVPNVSFIDEGGRKLTLEDFRGRTVLLNLWATWCVPCVEEMPTLDALQRALGGPGFEVVALSIDRAGVEAIRAFYEKLGLGFLAIYNDPSSRASIATDAGGLPTTLLIDGEGRELGRLVGPAQWDAPEMAEFLRGFIASSEAGSAATPRRSVWGRRAP
jgi:thiol-disulfide isomerase/thioredoxin